MSSNNPLLSRFDMLGIIAAAILFVGPAASAQTSSPPTAPSESIPALRFDVASIRQTAQAPDYNQRFNDPPHASKFSVSSFYLNQIVGLAYNVNFRYQIIGPDWITTTRYDINAEANDKVDTQLARMNNEQARLEKEQMLQALLADRFKLKAHEEMRSVRTYVLTSGPNPKLKVSTDSLSTLHNPNGDLISSAEPLGIEMDGHLVPISTLLASLKFYLQTPVVDQTSLTGRYDFKLQFHGSLMRLPSDTSSPSWPPLEEAVREQLGLKLTLTSAPLETLVIDSVEHPTPN